jgi:5-formyltetrahydrofolate cyclo-ligase
MEDTIREAKAQMRRQVRAEVNRMTPEERISASASARTRLTAQPQWQGSKSVLFFAPVPGELDIWPLLEPALKEGKCVCLPRFEEGRDHYVACRIGNGSSHVKAGRFGIREAADSCEELSLNRLDLILVPGVAFDSRGCRLGRGKGFYDQLLATACGLTCGVAFDQQIVREIPVEAHDVHVNCILTPSRWFEV